MSSLSRLLSKRLPSWLLARREPSFFIQSQHPQVPALATAAAAAAERATARATTTARQSPTFHLLRKRRLPMMKPPCFSSSGSDDLHVRCSGACSSCPAACTGARSTFATTATTEPLNTPTPQVFHDEPFTHKKVFAFPNFTAPTYKRLDHLSSQLKTLELPGVNTSLLHVPPEVLTQLTRTAFEDISFFLRTSHLKSLRNILDDPEASENDRFVALTLLKNANIAAGRVYPGCQDTGTAIIMAKKGSMIYTDGSDEEAISKGVYEAYTKNNLRYSQVAPKDMFAEFNTKTNLPAQVDILATGKGSYEFLFVAKGGGSANKTFFYQQTKALLNPTTLLDFISKHVKTIGTSACPPYHLAVVVGGLSAEHTLKTVKLASCHYLDGLPRKGGEESYGFRDLEWEEKVLKVTRELGIGAQFGGKYFCHDVRVIRLPRHGASCPVGIGVSCSADRQVLGYINEQGVFLEQLEENPAQFLPEVMSEDMKSAADEVVHVDLNKPMPEICQQLSQYGTATRLSLKGTMIVARDIAHAKLLEMLQRDGDLPSYFKNHPIYYAGPAKTPAGHVSGSFGPTTAGRMDVYVERFMEKGGSLITLAKGNRSKAVAKACKKYGGFYLGSIGGPAAILGQDCIKKVDVVAFPELGMEAVWKIEVEDFPAFVVIDDKGHDFYSKWLG